MATTVLKNNGADLPESQIQGILAGWKAARQNRSTAYLTSTLSVENIGFSPKDMMYNEASQYLSYRNRARYERARRITFLQT
jgi:hypothetical protein